MLTTALMSRHDISDHVRKHGDGVKILALRIPDATLARQLATERGAVSYMPPSVAVDTCGCVVIRGSKPMVKRCTCS